MKRFDGLHSWPGISAKREMKILLTDLFISLAKNCADASGRVAGGETEALRNVDGVAVNVSIVD